MKWVSVKVFSFCWCCTCRWWRCWAPLHTARSTSTGLCFDCSRQTRPVPGAHSAPPPAPRPCVGDRYGGPPSHAWRRRVCWTGRQQKPWLNEKSLDWQCEMVHKGLLNNHSKPNYIFPERGQCPLSSFSWLSCASTEESGECSPEQVVVTGIEFHHRRQVSVCVCVYSRKEKKATVTFVKCNSQWLTFPFSVSSSKTHYWHFH